MKTKRTPVPENWMDLKTHPLANLIGYGLGIDTVKLAEHMREHGYDDTEPIVLFEGQILDGRHRHVGAQEADVVPSFVELVEGNLFAFVAKKINRQHLDASQRAQMLAALIKAESESKEANLPPSEPTLAESAKLAKVSRRTMMDANKVQNEGSPELQKQVINGEVKVDQAAASLRSVFCPRCQRTGPQKNCPKCTELRKDLPILPKRTKIKLPKISHEKFNWKEYDKHLGHVIRGNDELKRAYPFEGTTYAKASQVTIDWQDYDTRLRQATRSDGDFAYYKCQALLREFTNVWKQRQRQITGAKD